MLARQAQIALEIEPALGAPPIDTGLPYARQEQTQWCWAACMEMALTLYGRPTRQCELSNAAFGNTSCCTNGNSSLCNQPLPIPSVAGMWLRYGVTVRWSRASLDADTSLAELAAKRPFEVALLWNKGGGHAVMVAGCRQATDSLILIVHDPWFGMLEAPHGDLLAAKHGGGGRWAHTWVDFNGARS